MFPEPKKSKKNEKARKWIYTMLMSEGRVPGADEVKQFVSPGNKIAIPKAIKDAIERRGLGL